MSALRIIAAASYAASAGDSPADIKSLLREEGGPRLRRSSRLTELALLGALRCIRQVPALHEQCALFLASAQGNVGDTVSLLQQIVRDGLEPMPFTFINVSSNMAGHAVAQALGLQGKNYALARHHGAFDSALELACLEVQTGKAPMALIGVVEECAWPLVDQRRRLGVDGEVRLAEQSSWLLLSSEPDTAGLASFAARRIPTAGERVLDPEVRYLPGPLLSASMSEAVSPLPAEPGYSESIAVHHLVEALTGDGEERVGYLNGDGDGDEGMMAFEFFLD